MKNVGFASIATMICVGIAVTASPELAQAQQLSKQAKRCQDDTVSVPDAEIRLEWARKCALQNNISATNLGTDVSQLGFDEDAGGALIFSFKEYYTDQNGSSNFISNNLNVGINKFFLDNLYDAGYNRQLTDAWGFKKWRQDTKRARPVYPVYGSTTNIYDSYNQQIHPPANLTIDSPCTMYTSSGVPTSTFYVNALCTSGSIDFVFVIDTTGSMWDDIDAVKSSSVELVDAVFDDVPDARVAVIDYKDFPQWPYGGVGDYPYRLLLDFSSDRGQVVGAIQGLVVGGGGDNPEAVYSGLMAALERPPDYLGNALSAWRSGAKKTVLVLGDAPPHDPEPVTGYTLQAVTDAAAAVGGLPGLPDLPGAPVQWNAALQAGSMDATGEGVAIYTLQIGYDPTAKSFFEALASATGGQSFTAASARDVVPAIREIIGEVGDDPAPANRPPETRWARASVGRISPPNHQMVDIDILGVMDADGDPVTVEITKITQDEPLRDPHTPDATGIHTAHAALRAERAGKGGGRVYRIEFTARDSFGAESTGAVAVCVPHDQGENTICDDNGQLYDATGP
jgi:hypothetical protein